MANPAPRKSPVVPLYFDDFMRLRSNPCFLKPHVPVKAPLSDIKDDRVTQIRNYLRIVSVQLNPQSWKPNFF